MKKTWEVIARFIVILLPLLVLCAAMYAQTGQGELAGTVTDPSGAIVVGVTVTATNVDTGVKTVRPTNSVGLYQILELLPGKYTVEAVAPGFKTFKREGITLHVGDRLTIDVSLALGLSKDVVSVTGEAPLLRTQDAQTGEVVDNTFIMNLPQLSRDPLALLTISGNVQGSGARANGGSGDMSAYGDDTRINGGRTSGIDYLVDGASMTSGVQHNVTSAAPTMDDTAEFKVITNGMAAEYGRASGGLVEVVTKSGSNQLHGQLFEYFQNNQLNAGSWLNNSLGVQNGIFRQNDFGFALGGPVFIPHVYHGKNKTFFFANYEGVRYSTGNTAGLIDDPTQAMRNGDFSQAAYGGILPVLYDQNAPDSTLTTCNPSQTGGVNGVSYQGCPGPGAHIRTILLGDGQHIPASLMGVGSKNDPTGLAEAVQNGMPLPNRPGDSYANDESSYQTSSFQTSKQNTFDVRIDENLTDNQRIYGRFSHQTSNYFGSPSTSAGLVAGVGNTSYDVGSWEQTLNYDYTINPTTIFSVRAAATFTPNVSGSGYSAAQQAYVGALPYPTDVQSIIGHGATGNSPLWDPYTGPTGIQLSESSGSQGTNYTNYQANVSLTKILTRHTVKLGFETRRYYDSLMSSANAQGWGGEYAGWWRFNQDPTSYAVGDFQSTNAFEQFANGYAAVLLGILDYDPTYGGSSRTSNFNYYAGYIQDDFKVNSKLTLNLGLRWDMETPLTERNNHFYLWDPSANISSIGLGLAPGFNWNNSLSAAGINPSSVDEPSWAQTGTFPNGMVTLPGTSQHPSRNINAYHPYQFAPRLGFAYQVDPKTVIRGSFAQMYLTEYANPNINSEDQDVGLGAFATGGWRSYDPSGVPFAHTIQTFANPYHVGQGQPQGQIIPATYSTELVNMDMTNYATSASAISDQMHMPYELTWSFGIQRELPKGFLVEATYSANQGHGLIGPYQLSQMPKNNFAPQYAAAYTTNTVQNPFVNSGTTAGVWLADLEGNYPFYGGFDEVGVNDGRSDYQSLNLRAERRLWHGMTFLFNYTYAKMLDDVGGAEISSNNPVQTGTGGKSEQSVDQINNVYGYSPLDETHRISATYSIELPFGRGHALLPTPHGVSGQVLDGIVGGWQLAGTAIYRSGRPVEFGDGALPNMNVSYGVEYALPNYASPGAQLVNPNYSAQGFGQNYPLPAGQGKFNISSFAPVSLWTYGTLAPIYGNIRQPGNGSVDLSMMKKFMLSAEGTSRYLQFRMEATNAFNIRGLANFNTDMSSPTFGYTTALNGATIAGNQERHAQLSARIVF